MTALRWLASIPIRLAVAAVGFYIDRAVRRLHELDAEEN
jgi:hypothetical protein